MRAAQDAEEGGLAGPVGARGRAGGRAGGRGAARGRAQPAESRRAAGSSGEDARPGVAPRTSRGWARGAAVNVITLSGPLHTGTGLSWRSGGGGARPTDRGRGSAGRRPAFHTRRASIHSSPGRSAHASDDSVDSCALTRLDTPEDSQRTLILEIETFRIAFA